MNPELSPAPVRILIIDDSPSAIRILSQIISGLGVVHFATGPEDGLRMAAELRPDLILLDVEMPSMNGYELCRVLKADAELSESPVIFVTSHRDSSHEVEGLEAGAVDFLSKPLHEAIVRARVKTHITLKRHTDALHRLATRDALTGVYNRGAFDNQIEDECRRHQRNGASLGLALIDIDHFKGYNDLYGHIQGDSCLVAIAHQLQAVARRPGENVARYGGEEFVVILPNTDLEGAQIFGERLCEAVRILCIEHGACDYEGIATISVGVAAGKPTGQLCGRRLVAMADKALYRAKSTGRNRVCVATNADGNAVEGLDCIVRHNGTRA